MMVVTLSESTPKARKDHNCSACEWLLGSGDWSAFTFSELREVVKAKRDGWRIKKGKRYIKQNNICDGKFYTYKAIPAIHDLCIDHNVFEDC